MDGPIFKLVKFCPVGFYAPNYPVAFCSLCRGKLTDVCSTCYENNCEICRVINNDDNYYHQHCYQLLKEPTTKKS